MIKFLKEVLNDLEWLKDSDAYNENLDQDGLLDELIDKLEKKKKALELENSEPISS